MGVRKRVNKNLLGHEGRDAQTCRLHLHHARFAVLADPDHRIFTEPHGAEQLTVLPAELIAADASALAPSQLSQWDPFG
jgi:hypothetical protein